MRVTTTVASGEELAGASCRVSNDKGAWTVTTPGEVQVRRSNNAIAVTCDKKPLATGHASVPSVARDAMYGNILFGGLIGVAIDHTSGAGYEYSPHVNVAMGTFTTVLAAPPDTGGKRVVHDDRGNLPEASGFADYRDITAVPAPKARSAYQAFLGRKPPRAFVLSETGASYTSSGGGNVIARTLGRCEERHKICRLYAYDDIVVWRAEDSTAIAPDSPPARPAVRKPEPPAAAAGPGTAAASSDANAAPKEHLFQVPADTGFASLSDPLALPFVDTVARERFQQRYLILKAPKAFAIGARGQWQYLANDPRTMKTILERCNASNKGTCWLYAVDDRVVWSNDPDKRISIEMLKPR